MNWVKPYITYTLILLAVLITAMVSSVMLLKDAFLAVCAGSGCVITLFVLYYLYDCLALSRRRRERLKKNELYQAADRKLNSDELFMMYCHLTENEKW